MSLIDRRKNECWKLQKFQWVKFQIMIVFCFNSWQAIDLLKKIITNIYNSFILAEIFTSFRNHVVIFCKFVIYHSICISWFNNDYLTVKHFTSFHSNSNLSRHFLYFDCYEKKITYHRRRHRNLVRFYILVFVNWNKIYFLSRNAKENNTTNVVFNKISKNVKINWNSQFLWWRVQILKCSTMTNHVLIFDW